MKEQYFPVGTNQVTKFSVDLSLLVYFFIFILLIVTIINAINIKKIIIVKIGR